MPFTKGHTTNVGRKRISFSMEHRKKISENAKVRWKNPEFRKKVKESYKYKFGEKNPNWKGGRKKDQRGYILFYCPKHPYAKIKGKRVREHRLIIEQQIGRHLRPKEVSHHINGIKDDNRPENLMAFSSHSAHMRFRYNPNNIKPEEIIFDGRKK